MGADGADVFQLFSVMCRMPVREVFRPTSQSWMSHSMPQAILHWVSVYIISRFWLCRFVI